MKTETAINEYLQGLENNDVEKMTNLFSPDAMITSALYGEIKPIEYYQIFFSKISKSKTTLINNFINQENPKIAGSHFQYDLILKNEKSISFERLDALRFNDDGKIVQLRIVDDPSINKDYAL